jgi:hypothetical protein
LAGPPTPGFAATPTPGAPTPGATPTPGAPIPGATPTPGAPTPGAGRSTTPGFATHPFGTPIHWQYTAAPAGMVIATIMVNTSANTATLVRIFFSKNS